MINAYIKEDRHWDIQVNRDGDQHQARTSANVCRDKVSHHKFDLW